MLLVPVLPFAVPDLFIIYAALLGYVPLVIIVYLYLNMNINLDPASHAHADTL